LPLFLDGELDARQMRAVAIHSSRCRPCEDALRHLERMQDLVNSTVQARVAEVDFSAFWPAIERQLGDRSVGWWHRLGVWWRAGEHPWAVRLPALGAAVALALVALLLFTRVPPRDSAPAAPRLAAVDNAAIIDSLETDLDSVAVVSDPETRTTVLWVSDDTVAGEVP
jgi:anti-sigma factor RsiW